MPPALIAALCTGPVTTPWKSPRRQAAPACSSAATVLAALAGSGAPKRVATAAGISTRGSTPGRLPAPAGASDRGSCSAAAAASRLRPSPNAVRSASCSYWIARTHSSGPTPAGSPGTSASLGRDISAAAGRRQADVDVGLAAQLAQVAVPFLLELALADGGARALARVLVGCGDLARPFALDDVPACRGAERCGDLAVLQCRDLGAEIRAVAVLCEPAQRAAAVGAGLVLRILLRELGEIGAAGDARPQRLDLRLGGCVAALAGTDQDVARLELGHVDGGVAGSGPGLDQLDQLEAGGR